MGDETKSKLVVVLGALASGGSERVVSVLSEAFCDKYKEVLYVLWKKGEKFYSLDGRVRIVEAEDEAASTSSLRKALWFRKFIKHEKPTLVLSFMAKYNVMSTAMLLGTEFPNVVAVRADPRYSNGGWPLRVAQKLLYARAKAVLCQSKCMVEFFNGNRLRNKTKIIYNPVFVEQDFVGHALNTPKTNKIVTVGRLVPFKRQGILIDGFALFLKNHPDYILEIYGKGDLKDELQKKIDDMHLQDNVFLKGTTKNVVGAIADAKAFVMTSSYEGMSNALIEAMVAGLPVVSTKVSGAVDLIENDYNGLLIEDSPEDVCNAICSIANNDTYARRLGEKATEIYNILRKDVISKQWIDFLASLI